MIKDKEGWVNVDKELVRKIKREKIEGEYILKNTDSSKKKIIFSTVIWYDPEEDRYYFKSESDMNGNPVAGEIVSHKLIQDLLSLSKWNLAHLGMKVEKGGKIKDLGSNYDHKLGVLKKHWSQEVDFFGDDEHIKWVTNVPLLEDM